MKAFYSVTTLIACSALAIPCVVALYKILF